jgi:hypothetical protein
MKRRLYAFLCMLAATVVYSLAILQPWEYHIEITPYTFFGIQRFTWDDWNYNYRPGSPGQRERAARLYQFEHNPVPLTLEQSRLLAEWAIESGAHHIEKYIDHSLAARVKRWWNAEDEGPVPKTPTDGQISDEKLEDIRKSVDALLN